MPAYTCLTIRENIRLVKEGIVKLLGMIVSPGNRRYFPDVIATDPLFKRPALSP